MKNLMRDQLSDPVSSTDHLRGRVDAPMQLVIYGEHYDDSPHANTTVEQIQEVDQSRLFHEQAAAPELSRGCMPFLGGAFQ